MITDELDAWLSRTDQDLSHWNTLQLLLEPREIIVAEGKDFRSDEEGRVSGRIPETLQKEPHERVDPMAPPPKHIFPSLRNKPSLPIVSIGDNVYSYVSTEQGVVFTIRIVRKKSEYETYLNKPSVHLIYAGHARYGRGACFGAGREFGDAWEEGEPGNRADTGLFRLGFRYIGIPVSEILKYKYTADLVEKTEERLPREDCHPDLRPARYYMRGRTLMQIHPELIQYSRNKNPTTEFWSYGAYSHNGHEMHVVLRAGWTGTLSAPHEIGAHEPKCRVFAFIACSTFKHNFPIVRKKKGWTKDAEANERFAYWTKRPAFSSRLATLWVYHILTYPEYNAYENWEPSLDYAVRQCNRDLIRDGDPARII
jgi:hypothetical protein